AIDWAIGHTLGSLLTFPLAWLALSARRSRIFRFRTTKEDYRLIGHLILIGGVTGLSLVGSAVSLLFLPIVPLMYATFRCGLRGALFGFVLILVLSIASLNFPGSYLNNLNFSPANEAKFLQLYFAILLLLALPVSIAIKQYNSIVTELREKRALEGLVADYSNDALINLGPKGEVRFCSPAGSVLSGLREPEGKSFTKFFDPLDEQVVSAALKDAAENPGNTVPLELSIIVDDETRWLEAKLRAVATEANEQIIGFAVTIRDITRRKQIELDATRMAETDPLTGLANRRAFFSKFEQRLETASARPFALAIIDLDHFKDINDRYGHTTGDAVLKLVGKLMRRFSQPGIFIARIGGEEFALLAEKVDPNEALNLCEHLRKEIASLMPVAHTGENISLTTSIGIAMIEERLDPSEAMRSADDWLYKAKRSGRNQTKMAA
ncbi:MAG: diguanylate cyclase domain-containing protein, partial [Qipengyuania vulgaris]